MITKILIRQVFFSGFLVMLATPVLSCPTSGGGGGESPEPGTPQAADWLQNVADNIGSAPVDGTITVRGLTTRGSAAGDSCAVAPSLPDGFAVTGIDVQDAQTGSSIGFGRFERHANASLTYCAKENSKCTAFVAKVSKSGIKQNRPLKVVIHYRRNISYKPSVVEDQRTLIRDSSLALGDIDQSGHPKTHVTLIKPRIIDFELGSKKY